MDFQIGFPESSSAEAGRLAQQLQTRLIEQGWPASAVSRVRANSEDMNIGETLQLAQMGLELFVATHGMFQLGQALQEFRNRRRTVLLLTTKAGASVRIDSRTTASQLADLLKGMQG